MKTVTAVKIIRSVKKATFTRRLLFAGVILALLAGPSVSGWSEEKRAKGELDGKTFEGSTGEKGKPAAEKEVISFTDGKFHSASCNAYGFGKSPYTTKHVEGGISFEAETLSPQEGRLRWRGVLKGSTVEGTYIWSKSGQKDIEYWFKGTLKK